MCVALRLDEVVRGNDELAVFGFDSEGQEIQTVFCIYFGLHVRAVGIILPDHTCDVSTMVDKNFFR